MPTKRIIHGVVASNAGGKIVVVPSDDCNDTSHCKEGCTSCGGKQAAQKITVVIPDAGRFPIGSRVEVVTWALNEALGALIVFGIPLFFALGALLIRYSIAPSTIESAPSLIGAACAFAAGCGVVAIIDRIFRRRYPSSAVIAPPSLKNISAPGGDQHG